jgi:hypothetical protein
LYWVSQIVLLNAVLLRLRRPIRQKTNFSLPFATLVTKPGEKTGLELTSFWASPSLFGLSQLAANTYISSGRVAASGMPREQFAPIENRLHETAE